MASMTPAASPSFPVIGVAMQAATITRTTTTVARIVAKYWKACAAFTAVEGSGSRSAARNGKEASKMQGGTPKLQNHDGAYTPGPTL